MEVTINNTAYNVLDYVTVRLIPTHYTTNTAQQYSELSARLHVPTDITPSYIPSETYNRHSRSAWAQLAMIFERNQPVERALASVNWKKEGF